MGTLTMNMVLIAQAGWVPERIREAGGAYSPELTWIGIWVAALLTFAMYSFLYKDNPVYKFGEHLYVGISVGYFIVLEWYNIMWPNLFLPLKTDPRFYWYLVIPGLLGVTMLFRFIRSLAWVSRYALAFYVAVGAGLAIPAIIQASLLQHMSHTLVPLWVSEKHWFGNISQILILIGVFSVLVYFFFSLEHRGAIGRVSQIGIWFLMISFGASFGYTVMARISLLIGRMQFLLSEWLGLKIG